jgi:protein SCO1/2
MRNIRLWLVAFLVATTLTADGLPPQLEGVGVDEHLGGRVDLGLNFTAEDGYPVALGSFFHKGRPVVLNLVYYSCPMLCTLVLNEQTQALRQIPWTAGKEFEVVTISIDPAETFNLAQQKRASYLASYDRASAGWHFLTSDAKSVKKLADEVGFHYRYDERQAQYAHPAVIMILTPEGAVSRYLYGIKFNPRDLRLALLEASESKTTISLDRILLYCYHYDPQTRGYVLFASNLMRAGGVLTVLFLGVMLLRLRRRERHAPRTAAKVDAA